MNHIYMLFPFLSHIFQFSSMIEQDSMNNEKNIEKIFDRIISLFKQNGLTDLSEKWDKILKNYYNNKEES